MPTPVPNKTPRPAQERFIIPRNAPEFFERERKQLPDVSEYPIPETFDIPYTGDAEFGRYGRIDTAHIVDIARYIPRIDTFLADIHWEAVFASMKPMLASIVASLVCETEKGEEGSTLAIVEAYPLYMAILGETLRSAGVTNVTYQFRREVAVNSDTRVLEATLFLGMWRDSPTLASQMEALRTAHADSLSRLAGMAERVFVLIEENLSTPEYAISGIDEYLRTQMGYKAGKVVYRVDTYPDLTFLGSHGVRRIRVYDSDGDTGKMIAYYRDSLSEAGIPLSFEEVAYPLTVGASLGVYEDFVVEANQSYIAGRNALFEDVIRRYGTTPPPPKSTVTAKRAPSSRPLTYIVIVPIVLLTFLVKGMMTVPAVVVTTTGGVPTSTYGGYYYYGGTWIP